MMSGSGYVTSTGHSNCPARGEPRRGRPNCPALLDDDLLREMSRNRLLCSTMGCEEAAGVFQAADAAIAMLRSTMGCEVMGCRRADGEVQLVSNWAAALASRGLG